MTLLQNQQLNDDDLELLSAYIDNQLVAEERGALEERLRREPRLRTALEELRGTVAVLRDLEPLRPPRSFVLDPVAFAPRPSPWFGWMRLGATLASVLLALTFAADLIRLGGGAVSTSAPLPAAAPTAAAAPAAAERSALTAPTAAPAAMSGAAEAPTAAPAAALPAPAATPEATAAPDAAAPTAEPAPTVAAEAQQAPAIELPTAAPAATAAPLMAPAEAPTSISAAEATQNDDTALSEPAADAQPTALPQLSYAPPETNTQAAPAGSAGGQPPVAQEPEAPNQRQASSQPLRPIRLVQIGLASLALLLGLGALWARRQSR
jgi:hypothetical protein